MTEKTIVVDALFESRSASLLVQTASAFGSDISVQLGSKTANAKSILGIASLGIADGVTIKLTANGYDERQAIPALEQFFTLRTPYQAPTPAAP